MTTHRAFVRMGLLAVLTLASGYVSAASNFIGPNGGDWNIPGHWSTGMIPTSSDDVTIGMNRVVSIMTQPAANCKTLSVSGIGAKLMIMGGIPNVSLTVAQTTTIGIGGQIDAGGPFTSNGAVTNSGILNVNNPNVQFDSLTCDMGGIINISGAPNRLTVTNDATSSGSSSISISSGGNLTVGGKLTASSSASPTITVNGAVLRAGDLTLSSGGSVTLSGTNPKLDCDQCNNLGGTITFNSTTSLLISNGTLTSGGTLDIKGGQVNPADVVLQNGSTTTFQNDATMITGSLDVQGGALLTVSSSGPTVMSIRTTDSFTSSGTVNVSNGQVNADSLTLLGGTATLSGSGSMTFGSGTIANGATLTINSASASAFSTGALNSSGDITVTNGQLNVSSMSLNMTGSTSITDGQLNILTSLIANRSIALGGASTLTAASATFSNMNMTATPNVTVTISGQMSLTNSNVDLGKASVSSVGSLLGTGSFANGIFGTNGSSSSYNGKLKNATKVGVGTVGLMATDAVKSGSALTPDMLIIRGGVIQLTGNDIIGDDDGIVIIDDGTLDLNNRSETLRYVASTQSPMVQKTGNIVLGIGQLVVQPMVADGTSATYSGTISGNGSVRMIGSGTQTLDGVCTYSGVTVVQAGVLAIGPTGIPDGSALDVQTGAQLAGTAAFTPATVKNVGSLMGGGSITLAGLLRVGSDNSSSTFSGTIDNLEKTGNGILTVSGAVGTGSGRPLTIQAGTLQLQANNVINSTISVNIFNGAALDLNDCNQTLYALTGQGQVFFGDSNSGNTLTLASGTTFFAGTFNGTNTTDVIDVTSGTATFSGSNSFRGLLNVSGGTLYVNGSFPAPDAFSVSSGATLGGVGTVGQAIVHGTIDPGQNTQAAILYASNPTVIDSDGTLKVNIPHFSQPADVLNVNGSVSIVSGATLNVDLTGYDTPTLITTPASYTVLTCTGSVSGTFTSLNVTQDAGANHNVIVTYTSTTVVVSIDDTPPTVDLNGPQPGVDLTGTIQYDENSPAVAIVDMNAATVTDLEDANLKVLKVELNGVLDGASETLEANVQGTSITAAALDYSTPGQCILLLTATPVSGSPIAQFQQVLRTLKYKNTSSDPNNHSGSPATRTIKISASDDGSNFGPDGKATVNVRPVDNPPLVDLDSNGSNGSDLTATFTEAAGAGPNSPVLLAPTGLVSNDTATLVKLTITLTNIKDTGLETLSATTTGTAVTANFTSATGVLLLSGPAPVTDFQTVLQTVAYLNTSQNPDTTNRIVTFTATDTLQDGPAATCTLQVKTVNDVPSFTKGADQTVAEDSGTTTVANWATAISAGPGEESTGPTAQTVQFLVTNDNNSLFSVQPAVSSTGTLTFTPGVDKNGTATVSVQINDNGGTANGGVDTSAVQTFTITVTAVSESFVVNTTADSGSGSLRDCMTRAGAGDTITFDPNVFDLTNSDAATLINVSNTQLPALNSGSVTIDASDRRVTINGSAAGNSYGIEINSSGNTIRGISIVGFTRSGVIIHNGGQNNTIGGSRNTGTGPNGQGLRISACGAFGVEVSGTGTSNNTVKGCWIGLDKSGLVSQSNLAGILLQDGASNNTIGSTSADEANVISGNSFEGVTVSGTGTDDNVIVGNFVGTKASVNTAVSRSLSSRDIDSAVTGDSSAGNGSSGCFMSRGTQRTLIGGESSGMGNAVGFNGGNGVEVRAQSSRRNSLRSNRIGSNKSGGIKLFDGSNNGISKPTIAKVERDSGLSRSVSSREGLTRCTCSGTADSDGTVEVYNDSGSQGSTYRGQVTVVNGVWTLSVDLDPSQNVTATYTDSTGNTSEFQVASGVGSTDGGSGGGGSSGFGADTDGDGIADSIEVLAGTDPNSGTDAPSSAGTLNATKFSGMFNFKLAGKDKVTTTLTLSAPSGFTVDGATVIVALGGYTETLTLGANGRSPKGLATVKLKQTAITTLTFSSKGDLQASFASATFTDRTIKDDIITLPIAVVLKSGTTTAAAVGNVTVSYTATQGKSGKVKLPK